MTLEQTNRVDNVTFTSEGRLALEIIEGAPFSDEERRFALLVEKLNGYMTFVNSRVFHEKHPGISIEDCEIVVHCASVPNEKMDGLTRIAHWEHPDKKINIRYSYAAPQPIAPPSLPPELLSSEPEEVPSAHAAERETPLIPTEEISLHGALAGMGHGSSAASASRRCCIVKELVAGALPSGAVVAPSGGIAVPLSEEQVLVELGKIRTELLSRVLFSRFVALFIALTLAGGAMLFFTGGQQGMPLVFCGSIALVVQLSIGMRRHNRAWNVIEAGVFHNEPGGDTEESLEVFAQSVHSLLRL